jgi:hypothetical protein
MHKCSWSPKSSADSTNSSGSHTVQEAAYAKGSAAAVADVRSDQGSPLAFCHSIAQLDSPAVTTSTSSTAASSDSPALQAQPLMPPEACTLVADSKPSTIQRSDSLDQLQALQADSNGLAGALQDDLSAAEEHAQQDRPQTAGRPTNVNSHLADGDISRVSASSVGDGDIAPEHHEEPGGSRRDTDASVATENTVLRQELSRLRAEHVTARIQYVLLQSVSHHCRIGYHFQPVLPGAPPAPVLHKVCMHHNGCVT